MTQRLRPGALALGILFAIGIAIRLSNALFYPIDMGFDAPFNWQYIAVLMRTWTLPPPDAGWSFAHPPLFYGLGALAGSLLGGGSKATTVLVVRILSAGIGVASIAAIVAFVKRASPGDDLRACIAAGLLLFLPVHLSMSAMLTEEILCSALVTFAMLGLIWNRSALDTAPESLPRAVVIGAIAGFALLTKLTGVLVLLTGVIVALVDGVRRAKRSRALCVALSFGLAGSIVGGWVYLRNWFLYGYLYPHALDAHKIMFSMPPGARTVADYLRFPPAVFTDPQLLAPDLLGSVWGSTYVTIWFDGHRHFLPAEGVDPLGASLLALALVPTAAVAVGLLRGARRAWASTSGPDLPMLILTGATLLGYVAFTLRNPWFVVLKGSFLLGLSLPFAYYGSETLAAWTRVERSEASSRTRLRFGAAVVACVLVLLAGLAAATFTYGLVIAKAEPPGLEWTPIETP